MLDVANDALKAAITARDTAYYMVDMVQLMSARPEEFVQKHPSAFLALWTQWVVLNALPAVAPCICRTGGRARSS